MLGNVRFPASNQPTFKTFARRGHRGCREATLWPSYSETRPELQTRTDSLGACPSVTIV